MSTHIHRPSPWIGIGLIVRRELGQYLRSSSGYVIAAGILLIQGLLFNVFAIGTSSRFSTEVLEDYFYFASGTTVAAALLFSMRLIAEERQMGTLPLLSTSSLTEGQIVFAKFLSGFSFLALLICVTLYMPAMIFVNGKVAVGHIAAGYAGLLLLGAATMAIGTFGSALASSQIIAIISSLVITVVMILMWLTSRVVEGPLGEILARLALHDTHFRPFMEGTISLSNIVFYLSVTGFFLMLARYALEARKWRA